MKLLLVIENLAGGGAERQMALLAERFADMGIQVTVASWASKDVADAYPLPETVGRIHLRKREHAGGRLSRILGNLKALRKLVRTIRHSSPSAVISFSEASNIMCVVAGRIARTPVIVSIRTDPEMIFQAKPRWRRSSLWAYRRAAAVVVQTEAVAGWCQENCGRGAHVIPNALRDLPRPSDRDRDPVIVSVGRLDFPKGHDLLIKAFAGIHEDHPSWRLLILGEGHRKSELEELARANQVSEKVELRGFTVQVEAVLDSCSIFALPTRSEGFPNALLEAMGMGLACISTDCDYGPAEIITDGEDGLLIPVNDVPALEAALRLLIDDAGLRAELGLEAIKVRSRFAPAAIVGKWAACAQAVSVQQRPL